MATIDEIKRLLAERNVFATEIVERENEVNAALRYYNNLIEQKEGADSRSKDQMKTIMKTSFITDFESLISVVCEYWDVALDDLRINNIDYTDYGCVGLFNRE